MSVQCICVLAQLLASRLCLSRWTSNGLLLRDQWARTRWSSVRVDIESYTEPVPTMSFCRTLLVEKWLERNRGERGRGA